MFSQFIISLRFFLLFIHFFLVLFLWMGGQHRKVMAMPLQYNTSNKLMRCHMFYLYKMLLLKSISGYFYGGRRGAGEGEQDMQTKLRD